MSWTVPYRTAFLQGNAGFAHPRPGSESRCGQAGMSGEAPVPPSIPSTTTTSAPALAANFTSSYTRAAPILTKMGTCQVGCSRAAPRFLSAYRPGRASPDDGTGCAGQRPEAGLAVRRFRPRPWTQGSSPPVPGFAPCPTVSSIALACRRWCTSMP